MAFFTKMLEGRSVRQRVLDRRVMSDVRQYKLGKYGVSHYRSVGVVIKEKCEPIRLCRRHNGTLFLMRPVKLSKFAVCRWRSGQNR